MTAEGIRAKVRELSGEFVDESEIEYAPGEEGKTCLAFAQRQGSTHMRLKETKVGDVQAELVDGTWHFYAGT